MTDYQRIETAITWLRQNFTGQPNLDQVAAQVHLSPFHFQRLFKDWAGVSPKKFLQYLSVEYAKGLLQQNHSLSDASFHTGLSGTSRLHDLFISIEGMTPGEYKSGGRDLHINYRFADTIFGQIIIASTSRGICHLAFVEDQGIAIENLRLQFPNAALSPQTDAFHDQALQIFRGDWNNLSNVKLHLKATPFQLKVWQTLLQIPVGAVSSYSSIAGRIEAPGAQRAVGTAIGANPVAFLIPCHRVIRSNGVCGDYHWGTARKAAILGWEAARLELQQAV